MVNEVAGGVVVEDPQVLPVDNPSVRERTPALGMANSQEVPATMVVWQLPACSRS